MAVPALPEIEPVAEPMFGVVKTGEVVKARTVPVPLVVYDVPQAAPVELAIPAPG